MKCTIYTNTCIWFVLRLNSRLDYVRRSVNRVTLPVHPKTTRDFGGIITHNNKKKKITVVESHGRNLCIIQIYVYIFIYVHCVYHGHSRTAFHIEQTCSVTVL